MNFKKLTYLCMQKLTNFPYIEEDFDALTNYELLSKVVEYLNEVIANSNEQNTAISSLYDAFTELQNYINNYFENLDVQEEINNKLDQMAADGSLTLLIKDYIDPIQAAFEEEVNQELEEQQSNINENIQLVGLLNTRIDGIEALTEGSTTGDAELADIRIAQDGLTYSTAGTSVRTQIRDRIEIEKITNDYFSYTLPSVIGAFSSSDLETTTTSTNRFMTEILNLNGLYEIECPNYEFNIYRKANGTTAWVIGSNGDKIQYNFSDSYVYRLLGKKSDSSTITNAPYFKIKCLTKNIDITTINPSINEVNTIKKSNENLIHSSINQLNLSNATVEDNKFYSKIGGVATTSEGSQTVMISVKPGEEYYVTGQTVSNLAGVIYWDSTKKFLNYAVDSNQDGLRHGFYDEHITVPANCYLMNVQTRDSENYPVKIKKVENNYTLPFDSFTALKRNAYIDKKLGYQISPLDKCYISITVDDSNVDIDVIAKLMKTTYNYPLNLATVPSKLYDDVTGTQGIGGKVIDINKYIEENGGEVLTHSFTVITEDNENNFSTMYSQFSNNKRLLENAGLHVNGIILSGGTGEVRDEVTDMWAREYYNYSDKYGESEPYYHPRVNIAKTNIDTLKGYIDNAVLNKTWLSLSFHGLYDYGITTDGTSAYVNGFTTTDLTYILNYIKTYTDNNQAAVVRFGYVYDNFGKFNP